MRFTGQVVWITGASSGIGEAVAQAFARKGARLVLSARRTAELERVRRACAGADQHVVAPLDLACPAAFPGIVSDLLARVGRIDVLINNGGISQRALVSDASLESERTVMEVDYFGTVALTKAVLPAMRARRAGHIVVVSSVMGYLGVPGRSSYAAAKHALHGYFDSLRAEVWRLGIAVTLVCPGYVRTAISRNALGPDGQPHDRMDATTENGIAPERCAAAIVRAVARRREEVYVGREAWTIYLKRFAPAIFSRLVRTMTFSAQRPQPSVAERQ